LLNLRFLLLPYFEHDAFMHHALQFTPTAAWMYCQLQRAFFMRVNFQTGLGQIGDMEWLKSLAVARPAKFIINDPTQT